MLFIYYLGAIAVFMVADAIASALWPGWDVGYGAESMWSLTDDTTGDEICPTRE